MNFKTTLILLAILIGVGVYVFTIESGSPIDHTTDNPEEPKKHFIDGPYAPRGLTEIEVSWQDGETGTLSRDIDGNWTQTKPVRFPMNRIQIQAGMGGIANRLTFLEKFKPGQDGKPSLGELNLENPKATVTFKGVFKDDDLKAVDAKPVPFSYTIKLGRDVTGSRGYAQINDDPHVYVITGQLHQIMRNDRVADWRAKRLVGPKSQETTRIAIESMSGESRSIELVVKDGGWRFAGKHSGRVNPKIVDLLVNGIGTIKMGGFHNEKGEPLKKFGLDKPQLVATFESTTTPKKRVLRVGSSADIRNLSYYATWSTGDDESTVVFAITGRDKARFETHVDEVRDPRVTPVRSTQVRTFSIDIPGQPLIQLEKSPGTGWSFPKDAPLTNLFDPDQTEVSKWIEIVASALSKGYVADVKPPALPAERVATIKLSSLLPRLDDTLVLFQPPAGAQSPDDKRKMIAVLRNDETTVYLVLAETFDEVLQPAVALRNRDVINVNPDAIGTISIKRYDGTTFEFYRDKTELGARGKPSWKMRGSDRFEAQALFYMLRNMNPLRCERWLAKKAVVDKKPITIVMKPLSSKGESLIFVVDAQTHQVTADAVTNDFVISKELIALIDSEFRPRVVIDITRTQLKEVAVQQGKHNPLRIERDERSLYRAIDETGQLRTDIKIDARGAASMFDALSPLVVERYIEAPKDLKPEQSLRKFELRTKLDRKFKVFVGFPDHPEIAYANKKWFTLLPDTVTKLSSKAASQKGEK